MGLLVRLHPGVNVAVLVVLSFPAKGARRGPRLDDEIVGLLKALPVVGRRGVVRDALPTGAADPPCHQPTPRYHVDHRKLFHQPQGVVPDRQDVAQQHDLRALGDLGQDRRFNVHGAAHAERRAVMLVEHDAVEAHLLGVNALVQISVVEVGAHLSIVYLVAKGQILDREPGRPEVT